MSIFPIKILLATDGSREAELAGQTAADLAQKTDSDLHVVHVLASPLATHDPSSFEPEVWARLEERAKDPGGCGGQDRGLWGKGGRLSPHNRASSGGDSRLSRGDRSGSDRDGRSGGRRDKEGAYGQRLRRGFPARTLPCVGGARLRPLSRTLRTVLYSPECVEEAFCELRPNGVVRSSLRKVRKIVHLGDAPSSDAC
jgi:hypothetical protein